MGEVGVLLLRPVARRDCNTNKSNLLSSRAYIRRTWRAPRERSTVAGTTRKKRGGATNLPSNECCSGVFVLSFAVHIDKSPRAKLNWRLPHLIPGHFSRVYNEFSKFSPVWLGFPFLLYYKFFFGNKSSHVTHRHAQSPSSGQKECLSTRTTLPLYLTGPLTLLTRRSWS